MGKNSVLFIVMIICGYLLAQQLQVGGRLEQITDPTKSNAISVEVAELIKGNKKLQEELRTLQDQKSSLTESSSSTSKTDASLNEQVQELKILTGETIVTGQGVAITFDKSLQLTQLVDLVNALRNIGVEAISINGTRIIGSTVITETMGDVPLTILAVGSKDVLHDSLLRRGGIMEQIGSDGQATTKDTLEIPSIK